MQESKAKSSQFGDMELTHTAFIQKLLKECKTKVCALSSTILGFIQLRQFFLAGMPLQREPITAVP